MPPTKLSRLNVVTASSLVFRAHVFAVFAGVVMSLAFAPFEIAGAAYVAPGAILIAASLHPAAAFRLGYLAGLMANLLTLRWLLNIPVAFAPILGWLALSAFLALYIATWTWLCARAALRFSVTRDANEPCRVWQTFLFPLFAAAAWTAMEMVSGRLLSGFPWTHLGNTLHAQIPLIQIASITGVPGVSFLVVWFSAALFTLVIIAKKCGLRSPVWKLQLVPPLLVIAVVMAWGLSRTLKPNAGMRSLRIAMVQPSVPQTMIWDAAASTNRFRDLLALSEQAMTNQVDLLIWPEAGLPGFLNHDEWVYFPVADFAKRHHVWIICGSDDAERKSDSPDSEVDYFNSAFLMNPEGRLVAKYDKQRLVMFGEYVPLSDWLPFLKWFTPITGGFTPGSQPVTFHLEALDVKTAVIICFEDVFASSARQAAKPDVDFLINLTNDGWFGEGAAQRQQAACAVFRALENRRPLVRCTNNGLTCWIDAHGRVREVFHDVEGSIYGTGFLNCAIEFTVADKREMTFYNRHGDVFGWTCVGVTLLGAATLIRRGLSRLRWFNSRA